jgi:hypothetical protein
MTLQEAKHQVAKNHGFTEFGKMLHLGVNLPSVYYNEASELCAKSQWNEAIEAAAKNARIGNVLADGKTTCHAIVISTPDGQRFFVDDESILKLKKP